MQQSAFLSILQALGYAIVNSLWHFATLWLICFLINAIARFSARQKYAMAVLAQLAGFFLFIASLFFSKSNEHTSNIFAGATDHNALSIFMNACHVNTMQLLCLIAVFYLTGLIFFFLKWLHAFRYAHLLKTGGMRQLNEQWTLFAKEISGRFGITRVSVYLSDLAPAPLTIGFLKPVILLPVTAFNNLTTAQAEAIILHELAHINRYDYLVNLLLSFIEVILFFNPFMRLLGSHVIKERENSCDDIVLEYNCNPGTYAGALLAIASSIALPSLAMYAADKKILLTRIRRIMRQKTNESLVWRPLLLCSTTLLLFLIFSLPAITDYNRIIITKKETPAVQSAMPLHNNHNKTIIAESVKPAFVTLPLINKPAFGKRSATVARAVPHIDYKTDYSKDIIAYINDLKATYGAASLAQLKSELPLVIRQMEKQNRELPVAISAKKAAIESAIHTLEQQAEQLNKELENYAALNNKFIRQQIPALFVMPPATGYDDDLNPLYNFYTNKNRNLKQNKLTGGEDKLIIIELPGSEADTATQHILVNGRLLKMIKL